VVEEARRLQQVLAEAGVRVRLDARTDVSFGRRATEWELKGIPVRVEVGPRDLANGEVTIVRRDTGDKEQSRTDAVDGRVVELLEDVQRGLLAEATEFRDGHTADVATIDEASEAAQTGFARIPWATLGDEGEARLAQDAVTVRCLQRPDGSVPDAEDEPDVVAIVSRAY